MTGSAPHVERRPDGDGAGARVAIVVCDSFGVGEAPDAEAYGDRGANTIGHTARAVGGLHAPCGWRAWGSAASPPWTADGL